MDDTDFSTNDFFVNPYATAPALHPKGIAATALISIQFDTDMVMVYMDRPLLKDLKSILIKWLKLESEVIIRDEASKLLGLKECKFHYPDLRDSDLEELTVALEDMDAPDFNREHPRNAAMRRRFTGCHRWFLRPILVLELMVVVDLSDLEVLELLSEKLACVPTPILEVPFAFEYSPELLPY
nr:hypothetical protein Iba_chr13eCG6800 [Ipomoea batatas]